MLNLLGCVVGWHHHHGLDQIFRVIEEGELGAFFYSKVRVSRLLNDMRKENLLTMVYARRKNTLYTLNTAQELATDDEVADSDRAEAEVVQGA